VRRRCGCPAEPVTAPPCPRVGSDVAGDEAGTYAAERIGGCLPLLSRRVLRQVSVWQASFPDWPTWDLCHQHNPPETVMATVSSLVRQDEIRSGSRPIGHQVEPDLGELAQRYGADKRLRDWRERLVCSGCGSRQVDMVVIGPIGAISILGASFSMPRNPDGLTAHRRNASLADWSQGWSGLGINSSA
jgi:hypothetical protein